MEDTKKPSGNNGLIITLVVLAVVAVGALAFISGKVADKQTVKVAGAPEVAEPAPETEVADQMPEITPGNPVVATLGDTEITRNDVIAYMRNLPVQVQQLPLDQIFPAALEQIINEKLVRINAEKVNLDNDPVVKKKLAAAKKEIVATVFLKNAIDSRVTEENLKKAYDAYVADLEEVEEAKAAHILVETKDEAVALIQQLEAGADFAELAQEQSKDIASAKKGGDIGYFAATEVVPEFAEASFAQEIGKHSFEPVKSQFGYHIILVEDRRTRPTPTLDELKPMLEGQIRQAALKDMFDEWRANADLAVYDINGQEIMPAAGEEEAAVEAEPATEATDDSAPEAQ
ncbi:MAG: hypothetical protein CL570_01325 [Alphaproteobacteria bacterium]|nr:hypothetical protein [Alphaproteobacteria bacterium]|tara:strand:+ start:90967 stop:92001 length:1035 start_codon:yes stop_codon:yes gene_type:complete